MSEAVSALGNASWSDGIAEIHEIGPVGMITLRGTLGAAKVKSAVKSAAGVAIPGKGKVVSAGGMSVAWMSPDELLILCPFGDVAKTVETLTKALAGQHALVVDVTHARAVFRVSGAAAREVLAKLAPVDLSPHVFEAGAFRRTRLAQIPAAFRMVDGATFEIICFRSVAQYVFDLLKTAAQPGSEVGYF